MIKFALWNLLLLVILVALGVPWLYPLIALGAIIVGIRAKNKTDRAKAEEDRRQEAWRQYYAHQAWLSQSYAEPVTMPVEPPEEWPVETFTESLPRLFEGEPVTDLDRHTRASGGVLQERESPTRPV